ncbi:MAG: hypothetical protein HYY13_07160 [Nitrospirae bacterium]|nr:hypothetical protein [Nitrospirota bacterium]
MIRLFHKKLVIVSGKGGVGKSTLCAALAILARRKDRRPLILELTEFESIPTVFGSDLEQAKGEFVADGIRSTGFDFEEAVTEYLTLHLKVRAVSQILHKNPVVKYFTRTAPGFKELVYTGKIWYMAQDMARRGDRHPFDFMILDAPSTGQCLEMLRVPGVVSDMVRVGPIMRETRAMEAFYKNPDESGILLITLLQEMPVNEVLQMSSDLTEKQGLPVDAVVINQIVPVDEDILDEKARATCPEGASEEAWAALQQAVTDLKILHDAQETFRKRLAKEIKAPQVELPLILKSPLSLKDLDRLATTLEENFE